MRKPSFIVSIALSILFGISSCHRGGDGDGGPIVGKCSADPRPITSFNLVATTPIDRKNPCKEAKKDWEKIKSDLQTSKILSDKLSEQYENYEFYKVDIRQNADLLNKYNDTIRNLKQNMAYNGKISQDSPLGKICEKLTQPQPDCVNCVVDAIAITMTEFIEPDNSKATDVPMCSESSHCDTYITFCNSKDTYYGPVVNDPSSYVFTKTISDLITDPECKNITIEDGFIVFPKSIASCFEESTYKYHLCDEITDNTSIVEEDNQPENENDPSSENEQDQSHDDRYISEGIRNSTKLKLELLSKYKKEASYNYAPSSKEDVLSTLVEAYHGDNILKNWFSCTFK